MFSHLFFLLLILTLFNGSHNFHFFLWETSPLEAFEWGFGAFFLFSSLCYFQIRFLKFKNHSILTALANVELCLFFFLLLFGLGIQRVFPIKPGIFLPSSLLFLFVYFLGLGWNFFWIARLRLKEKNFSPFEYAWQQVLFLVPFCFPFLLLTLFYDFFSFLSLSDKGYENLITYGFGGFFLFLIALIMPPLMMICWKCKPLKDELLLKKLENVCQQMEFRHGGMKIWSVMSHTLTAGIVGILPRFRYVMFTEQLIKEFSPEEIQAILVHEIGHSRYYHLWLYPFIFLGIAEMVLFLSGFSFFQKEGLFYSFIEFSTYGILLGLYFRVVFGFFSRLFERQADLSIFDYSLSPTYLIQALDHLGIATGYTHHQASWHHGSIQQRIDFLELAIKEPQIIQEHHRKVKKWIGIYFFLFSIGVLILMSNIYVW